MGLVSRTFQRHPALDLTRQPFAPSWWARLALLSGLMAAAIMSITVQPDLKTAQNAPLINIGQTAQTRSLLGADKTASLTQLYETISAAAKTGIDPTTYIESTTITLQKDETLSDALMRNGFSAQQSFAALARLDDIYNVRRARPDLALNIQSRREAPKEIHSISLKSDFKTLALVTKTTAGAFQAERLSLETRETQRVASAPIPDSLYLAAKRQNMPAATILSLIRALSYRVDFQREIRPEDHFKAIYTRAHAADGSSQAGDILYAELDLGDRIERLYRFTHPKTKRADYFDASGESMRRLLMRTPIDGARLTSRFGKRKHPVLGYVKSHQGVDFGAPTGTPIYAAGDGIIERANRYGSYGNYVRIKHPRGYKTAYAHLSRFAKNMKSGRRVRQGQVIGYVGATGRVTGAHLHYEVYKGAKRVNPMRLDLPTGEVLSGDALSAFQKHKTATDTLLETHLTAQAKSASDIAPAAGQ
ncbi:MAG: peptidoglycan DD-metalloendopeptidase family protein [Pseudomonadota bacterium]